MLCRHTEADHLRWNSLPQHLMDLILDSVLVVGGNGCIASMRLVSKSWLAAVRAHPMKPKHMSLTANHDLVKLCGIMPHMAGLDFNCAEHRPDLSPLSAQTSLSHLSIGGHGDLREPPLLTGADLSHLPKSLRSLALQTVSVQPGSFGSLSFASLRELTIDGVSASPALQELLTCLPNLEVNAHRLSPRLDVSNICVKNSALTCVKNSALTCFQALALICLQSQASVQQRLV